MANFTPKITDAGAALLARVEAGEEMLNMTRMALGDGALPGEETEEEQTALINEVMTANLASIVAVDNGVTARADFSNATLVADLEARELGLFAEDPDDAEAEILVVYANAGAGYDYLPAAGGADLTTLIRRLHIVIANTDQVTLLVDEGAAYVTQETFLQTLPLLMPTGAVLPFAMPAAPGGWLECNGAEVSRETYADLLAAITSTAEVTFANQAGSLRVNWAGNIGMPASTPDNMSATFTAGDGGTLPTGIVAGTEYLLAYISSGAYAVLDSGGTPIAYSDAGSGELHGRAYPFGIGDGATTFNVPELRSEFVRGWSHGRASAGDNSARAFGTWQPATLTPVDITMTAGNEDAMGIGPDGATIQGDVYDAADYPGAKFNNVNGDNGAVNDLSATPANATGTHPRNIALMYCIKY